MILQHFIPISGGKQFDMMQEIERLQMEADGAYCDSEYGLCE